MKTIYLCGVFFSLLIGPIVAQTNTDSISYGLTSREWKKANETWNRNYQLISIVTTDSVIHTGQILLVSDSTLLLYEDEGIYDASKSDSMVHEYKVNNILLIAEIRAHYPISGRVKRPLTGGLIGALAGTALHLFAPGQFFHEVYIIPATLSGLLVGMAVEPKRPDKIKVDTTIICTRSILMDTVPSGYETPLVTCTDRKSLWRKYESDSGKFAHEKFQPDSGELLFEHIADPSRRLTRLFPIRGVYVSLYGKNTYTKYADPFYPATAFLLNGGYRFNLRWAVEFNFSNHYAILHQSPITGSSPFIWERNFAFGFSCGLLRRDRFNTQRWQCETGMAITLSTIEIKTGISEAQPMETAVAGVMLKLNAICFVTNRLAMIAEMQNYSLPSITFPQYSWQGVVVANDEKIDPSGFLVGFGLRYYL